jgi:DNA adenine methylase
MQMSPDAMADAVSWPVSEADLHARHLALVKWRNDRQLEHLMGDPTFHDPVMAGWWAWGQSCWIGSGWCSGNGPWIVDDTGRIARRGGDGGGDGVSRRRPHLSDNGQGVNRPQAREPGVSRQLPHLGNNGQGVNHAGCRERGTGDEFHPMTMPELRRWFQFLSARLRHVRILNGDWRRAVTGGASLTLPVRMKKDGACGIFLDPPYADTASRADKLYAEDSLRVAHDVRAWCIEHGGNAKMRIVLAGFDGEHNDLERHGWRSVEWYRGGFLKGGMANTAGTGKHQQSRERLWLSPACLVVNGEDVTNASPIDEQTDAVQPIACDGDGQLSMWGGC